MLLEGEKEGRLKFPMFNRSSGLSLYVVTETNQRGLMKQGALNHRSGRSGYFSREEGGGKRKDPKKSI